MPRNAYTLIKDALEGHYCAHPEFFRGPNGAEMCPPLDDALQALDQIEEACRESREALVEYAPGMSCLISKLESVLKP